MKSASVVSVKFVDELMRINSIISKEVVACGIQGLSLPLWKPTVIVGIQPYPLIPTDFHAER